MLSVSAGGSHTLAICETGELWACGRGRHGQLGFGSFEDVTTMRPIASLRQALIASCKMVHLKRYRLLHTACESRTASAPLAKCVTLRLLDTISLLDYGDMKKL